MISVQIIYFFLIQSWKDVYFQKLVHFFYFVKIVGTVFHSIFIFFCIFVILVAISLSFLILFISNHSLFFLMSLAKGLLTLFIFSKNQLSKNQVSFIFSSVFCLFYLYPFWSFFWLFVSSLLPVLIHLDGR